MRGLTWRDVLVLGTYKKHQATIRRHYLVWRQEQGLALRCDNQGCQFHRGPLEWNGGALPLVLDHREGNRYDNTPGSLHFLCPNCDSQRANTRGGANKGKVKAEEIIIPGGYTLHNRDATRIVARAGDSFGSGYGVGVGIAQTKDPT